MRIHTDLCEQMQMLLPVAYCPLPAACGLLPAAYCSLPAACCLLLSACCLHLAACCLLFAACNHPHSLFPHLFRLIPCCRAALLCGFLLFFLPRNLHCIDIFSNSPYALPVFVRYIIRFYIPCFHWPVFLWCVPSFVLVELAPPVIPLLSFFAPLHPAAYLQLFPAPPPPPPPVPPSASDLCYFAYCFGSAPQPCLYLAQLPHIAPRICLALYSYVTVPAPSLSARTWQCTFSVSMCLFYIFMTFSVWHVPSLSAYVCLYNTPSHSHFGGKCCLCCWICSEAFPAQ